MGVARAVSDYQKLVEMLCRAGVTFHESVEVDGTLVITIYAAGNVKPDREPNPGYTAFYTEWKFNPSGALRSVGVWE